MELSDRERRMVEWLRRQDAAWRSTRVITTIGSALAVLWAALAWVTGESPIAATALGCVGVFGLSYAVGSWAGRPEIALLLKLIDHHKEEKHDP